MPRLLGFLLILHCLLDSILSYGRITTRKNDRVFNEVHFMYDLNATREGDLPFCTSQEFSVCSLVHRRFCLPVLSQRLCRCRRGQCPYRWDPADHKSIILNSRIQMKFCQTVESFPTCSEEAAPAAWLTQHRPASGPDPDPGEQRDVQVNCTCRYPNYHRPVTVETLHNRTRVTVFSCVSLSMCGDDESCAAIREDTYSMYYTCLCPAWHRCGFDERRRNKVRRPVQHLFYSGSAYMGVCQPIGRY